MDAMTTPHKSTRQTFTEGGYEIEIAVQGYPGKAVCHGGLGWSTIALLKGHGRVALIDTGSFGQRNLILERLKANGLAPTDVTDVLLTHSHWDHSINWVMFPNAKVYIDGGELAWSLKEPWGTTPVPELYVRELNTSKQLVRIAPGAATIPGISVHAAPGHTPGQSFSCSKARRATSSSPVMPPRTAPRSCRAQPI